MRQNQGLFGPWKFLDKLKLAGIVLGGIGAIVLVTLPVGLVALAVLYGLMMIWVAPSGEPDSYFPDSRGFKAAQFFQAMKAKKHETFTPLVLFGFGPPVEDPTHGLEEPDLFKPPFRLAAWWAVIGGLGLALIDVLVNPFLFPFWGGPYLSIGWLYLIPSAIGWAAMIQALANVARWRAEGVGLFGADSAPATMLNLVWQDISPKQIGQSAGIWAAVPLVVGLILWPVTGIPIIWIALVAVVLSLVILFAVASRQMMHAYRAEWFEKYVEPRNRWAAVLEAILEKDTPMFAAEDAMPSREEFYQTHEEDEPYEPRLYFSACLFNNESYQDMQKRVRRDVLLSNINDQFGDEVQFSEAVIAPMGEQIGGQEIVGTEGFQGFRIYFSPDKPSVQDIYDPGQDDRWREYAVRATLMRELRQELRGGDGLIYKSSMMLTRRSEQHIAEVTFVAPTGIGFEEVLEKTDKILSDLEGVPWLRVARPAGARSEESSREISILIGDRPRETTKYTHRARGAMHRVESAEMAYVMYKSDVRTKAGAIPTLVKTEKVSHLVTESEMKMPQGLSSDMMRKLDLWTKLGEASQKNYLEIRIADDKPGHFYMTSADKDPLAEVFPMSGYRDELLTGRVGARPNLKWGVGVFANGEIGWDDFEKGAEPHLLIAGSSGSGKSVCLQSMIVQLAYNNTPDQLVFWLIEPKIGLQRFKRLDTVQRFVDSWYPHNGDLMRSSDEATEDLLAEMVRRSEMLAKQENPDGSVPEKLSQGHDIADKEGDTVDEYGVTQKHPLRIPYLICIIEECGTLFADPPTKEEMEYQKRILSRCARIAREGRAGGVYLVCTTQYPTNASIPSVIRNQMRRVGLACRNRLASEVVIEQPGLEKAELRINKGSGMIMDGLDYRRLRMFWLEDGDTTQGKTNDIVDNLGGLPQNSIFPPIGSAPATDPSGDDGADAGKSGGKKKGKKAPPPSILDSMDFTVPAPSPSILNKWASKTAQGSFEGSVGASFDQAIDTQKKTADVTDDDYDDLISILDD